MKKLSAVRKQLLLANLREYRLLVRLGEYKGRVKGRVAPLIAEYRRHRLTGEFAR